MVWPMKIGHGVFLVPKLISRPYVQPGDQSTYRKSSECQFIISRHKPPCVLHDLALVAVIVSNFIGILVSHKPLQVAEVYSISET